jgi:hypothetical protein
MVMRLIDPEQPIRWIHPEEMDSDNPTVFHLLPITEGVWRKIRALSPTRVDTGGAIIDEDGIRQEMFLRQVVAIENVTWPDGKNVAKIEGRDAVAKFYDHMEPRYAEAIYIAIQNTGKLKEGEVKN